MADTNLSSFIWSVADLLRGDYNQSEYGKVFLPFTVLRRLDCVLERTKSAVLAELDKRTGVAVTAEPFLLRKAGQLFYNGSRMDLKKLMGDLRHRPAMGGYRPEHRLQPPRQAGRRRTLRQTSRRIARWRQN
jgi:type I restriction enzyme M protein